MTSSYTSETDAREVAQTDEIHSTAAINGHPIHPMLIPFPISFLSGALLTDVVFALNNNAFWAQASMWLLIAGVVMGVVAATAGAIDFWTLSRVRKLRTAWLHFLGNATVLVLAFINLLQRVNNIEEAVLPWGLMLSLVTALLLVATGWWGGQLAYHHKVGVNSHHH